MEEKFEKYIESLDVKSLVIAMILSAFGFLVALVWRDAIQQTIDLFIPQREGLYYTYIAAIIVTVIAVFAAALLIKIKKRDIIPDYIEKRLKMEVEKRVRKRMDKIEEKNK